MATVRRERPGEAAAREALLDLAYGPARFAKTSERLREGRLPELSLVATEGRRVVGTVRLWSVAIPQPDWPALRGFSTRGRGEGKQSGAMLLGPLAVHPSCRRRGIGSALVERALREAQMRGHGAVLLVGDAAFYGRFGFSSEKTGALWLPGSYEKHRLLAIEIEPGALDGARGFISASGAAGPRPDLTTPVAELARNRKTPAPRAA